MGVERRVRRFSRDQPLRAADADAARLDGLETLLRQNGRGSMVRTRELLVRLARAFAESIG